MSIFLEFLSMGRSNRIQYGYGPDQRHQYPYPLRTGRTQSMNGYPGSDIGHSILRRSSTVTEILVNLPLSCFR